MNTKNLKSYAPKARRQFMDAIEKRAAHFGIYPDKIAPVVIEGGTALIEGRAFSKHQGLQRKHLEKQLNDKPLATHQERFELFIREIAYTWFNRFAALRYMELHDYLEHGFRVLSNKNNNDALPEILDHAADVADTLGLDKAQIVELQLAGNQQELLYRELLLGQCHHLHKIMPFLFEAIDDATELLLPDNLTKTDSLLKDLVNEIPEEDWQQIEVIGWLYQFYISEHKDAVIGKVVKSEDIPAATQLFTPNWIVKYLVQNSIGRQWLATYPDSSIKTKMEYYIEPAEQTDEVKAQLAAITPSSIDPESIKALDPACGSGHILVEIYELLREIYLERGYRLREIPELLLTKNIYGLDIDGRAAQLAGFALLMKAREDDRRIFQRVQDGSVKLNVYALQSTEGWDSSSLWKALNLDGKAKQGSSGELFGENAGFQQPTGHYAEYFDLLKYLIMSFEQAKTLGSLIQIDHQYLPTLKKFKDELLDKLRGSDPAAIAASSQILPVVEQSILLAQKYDAVIANPPYMGNGGMNSALKDFAKSEFPNSKADLFAIFMERTFKLLTKNGNNAQVNMQSWMFLSSYEKLRENLLDTKMFLTMAHLGARAFGQISGEVVQTTAWVISNSYITDYVPNFLKLTDGRENDKKNALLNKENIFNSHRQCDFKKIPTAPICYWGKESIYDFFSDNSKLEEIAKPRQGLATSDDERFLRFWYEVDAYSLSFNSQNQKSSKNSKWFPFVKGGSFRRWYGNNLLVINWGNDGDEVKEYASELYGNVTRTIKNIPFYFKEMIAWSLISGGKPSFRYQPKGQIFGHKGPAIFSDEESVLDSIICYLNSSLTEEVLSYLSPSLSFEVGAIKSIPFSEKWCNGQLSSKELIKIAKLDADSFELSWDFQNNPILINETNLINYGFSKYCLDSRELVERQKYLEEENNKKIAIITGIDGLKTDVSFQDITLDRNPEFTNPNDNERETIFRCDTLKNLVSYFIGCAFGRYSLNREGLVYAHSGSKGFKELVAEGVYKSFPADDDGIIPLASENWLFEDDATARFREFVKTVWGAEHLQENLEFVAESLCLDAIKPKKGESAMETIRRYFSTQFFTNHCKMYKKRPIYWLFSSGKEKAFECLVYLHRYNEATLSRMRTEYVTPLMGKYTHLIARKTEELLEATGTEQRRIEKEIKELEKKQLELRKFDEELKHYAEMRISLDLDDGVKVNYGKFGNLLANVKDICG